MSTEYVQGNEYSNLNCGPILQVWFFFESITFFDKFLFTKPVAVLDKVVV